jgi:steroid delta-isomerase-like uncharacterized protein
MADHDAITLVRAQYDAWNAKNYDTMAQGVSDDFVLEGDTLPAAVRGKDGLKMFAKLNHTAFPDLEFKITDIFASPAGDQVMVMWTATGTHRGEYMTLAPTGKRGRVNGSSTYRVKDGKVTRANTFWDHATLLRQLGALPAALSATRERERPVDVRPSA